MKRLSVLIIKKQSCELCRLWVCFIALRCPVQRWIIIMLPLLLMDMRLEIVLHSAEWVIERKACHLQGLCCFSRGKEKERTFSQVNTTEI